MRTILTFTLLAVLMAAVLIAPAMAGTERPKEDIQVAVEVRSGKVYDYLLIGMKSDATDGKDNLYDTLSPGLGMNDQYISMVVPHPEWQNVKTEYRTDFRSFKKSDTWEALINTNLPDGTLLTLSIDWEQTRLPASYAVVVEDLVTGATQAIDQGAYVFPVTTSGIARQFRITVGKERGKQHR